MVVQIAGIPLQNPEEQSVGSAQDAPRAAWELAHLPAIQKFDAQSPGDRHSWPTANLLLAVHVEGRSPVQNPEVQSEGSVHVAPFAS